MAVGADAMWIRAFLAFVFLLGLWQFFVMALALPSYLVPTPLAALTAISESWLDIGDQFSYTATATAAGVGIGFVTATLLAVAFQGSPTFSATVMPLLIGVRVIPFVALAPIIALVVGRNIWACISVVWIASFFPIMVGLGRGLASAKPEHVELLHVYAASRGQALRHVQVPAALPHLFGGLRVAVPAGFLAALIAEWLTGSRGLGFMILDAADNLRAELLWGLVLLCTFISLCLFCTLAALEHHFDRERVTGDMSL
jgi:ABC-type nitrate/sulfonate/bicarbonate transport system permease component